MEELREPRLAEPWENAAEVLITTALELNRHDHNNYKVGRLLITTVTLRDVGLVG